MKRSPGSTRRSRSGRQPEEWAIPMLPGSRFRAAFLFLATVSSLSCSGPSDSRLWALANRIHERAVVIDAHAHPKPGSAETLNLGEKTGTFELDFITMKEGGLDGVFFTAPLLGGQDEEPKDPGQILEDINSIVREVQRLGDLAEIARSTEDIRRIHGLGKRAVLLGIEGGGPFGEDLGTLERYFDAGVRMVTFPLLPSVTPGPERSDSPDQPLSDFGRRVIEEMNRLGMIIDISHASDRHQVEIIRTSVKPVVASHSCTRALNDIPREMPDSIIKVLAAKGGVISVTFSPRHISADYPERTVTEEDLVDHVDHIVRIAGVDHVGFGSDFLGGDAHTVGLESAAGLPNLTFALLKRGYSRREIEKILGGNLLRVFEAVEEGEG